LKIKDVTQSESQPLRIIEPSLLPQKTAFKIGVISSNVFFHYYSVTRKKVNSIIKIRQR